MYIITRNSNARFTADLCSRVTFVNFTIRPSSLEDQCLNIFLRNERPDVEEKRLSLMKIQGEYVVKFRELEDSLLEALSMFKGQSSKVSQSSQLSKNSRVKPVKLLKK
jgi:dynein heavy chain 1